MKLDTVEFAKVLGILDKIDQGLIEPRFPGSVGRFLRQYRGARTQVDTILHNHSVRRRADGAVSGTALGAVSVQTISDLKVSILGFPFGEVADTLGISEELGGLTYLRMWLKGPTANAAFNELKQHSALRLSGDFRWSPLSRITTGTAGVSPVQSDVTWQHARCLKAVADDLIRPPHALEFVLDYRIGPPSLKCFRCVCAIRRAKEWHVLPGLASPRSLSVVDKLPNSAPTLGVSDLAALLIYCEPWSQGWTIADAVAIGADDAFGHAITWVDFQRELRDLTLDSSAIEGVTHTFRAMGLNGVYFGNANLTRSLLPVARDVLRDIRGFG